MTSAKKAPKTHGLVRYDVPLLLLVHPDMA